MGNYDSDPEWIMNQMKKFGTEKKRKMSDQQCGVGQDTVGEMKHGQQLPMILIAKEGVKRFVINERFVKQPDGSIYRDLFVSAQESVGGPYKHWGYTGVLGWRKGVPEITLDTAVKEIRGTEIYCLGLGEVFFQSLVAERQNLTELWSSSDSEEDSELSQESFQSGILETAMGLPDVLKCIKRLADQEK